MGKYENANLNYLDYNLVVIVRGPVTSVLENSKIYLRKTLMPDVNNTSESVSIHFGSTKLGSSLRVDI